MNNDVIVLYFQKYAYFSVKLYILFYINIDLNTYRWELIFKSLIKSFKRTDHVELLYEK